MLKKQTVWLLTMLSLMIVLSVYYMSSPNGGDFAFINQDMENAGEETALTDTENQDGTDTEASEDSIDVNTEEGTVTSSTASDELFTTIRMEREDARSRILEQLDGIMAASNSSTDEKSQAYEEIKEIENIKAKETIVEEKLKDQNNYPDVLVRAEGNDVVVTVKTEGELSPTEANEIVQVASSEFGQVNIDVEYQPAS